MEILQKILFFSTFIVVTLLTAKFACNTFIGNKKSIIIQLQKENPNMSNTKEVLRHMDFDKLVKLYQKELDRLEEYKRNNESEEIQNDNDTQSESYEPIHSIEEEIETRELNKIKYSRIGFYWVAGVLVNILGYFMRKRINILFEVTLFVLGMTLQIYALNYSCDLYIRIHAVIALILSCITLLQLVFIGFHTKVITWNNKISLNKINCNE